MSHVEPDALVRFGKILRQQKYAELAAQAERDHRAANERFAEAKTASEMSSFRQVVFSAAAAGVTKVNLDASDQGDHMSLIDVEPEELHTNELDNDLWDGISDLSDYTSSDWIAQPGVDHDIAHRDDQIIRATIDIKVAAEALLANDPSGTYPQTVVTVTVASYEDAGAQYTLIYPDGRRVLLGDAEDNYSVLASVIDDEHDKPTD